MLNSGEKSEQKNTDEKQELVLFAKSQFYEEPSLTFLTVKLFSIFITLIKAATGMYS